MRIGYARVSSDDQTLDLQHCQKYRFSEFWICADLVKVTRKSSLKH
jgi:hypothetical protein